MRIILTGLPGAGKGTQAHLLAQFLELPHISTGDLFRQNIADSTELGQTAKTYIDSGELVPSYITVAMVNDRLGADDVGSGFILDGFPRTVDQAMALDELLSDTHGPLDAVLDFTVSEQTVLNRMLARGRADDTDDVIRTRLRIYNEENKPLLHHYSAILCSIDAEGEVEDVHARVVRALGERLSSSRPGTN
ncbi:adenylate kinase [Rhodococcus sp. NPDC004095]